MQAAKTILRHLLPTLSIGFFYKRGKDSILIGFSNSEWAGCMDDRRSTRAYLFKLGTTPISWSTKKLPTVSPSSTESIYRALMEATIEAIWLGRLLKEQGFGQTSATPIYCDNQGSIRLTRNPLFHSRTKYFAREMVDNHTITVAFVKTTDRAADIRTKSQGKTKFHGCKNLLGLCTSTSLTKNPEEKHVPPEMKRNFSVKHNHIHTPDACTLPMSNKFQAQNHDERRSIWEGRPLEDTTGLPLWKSSREQIKKILVHTANP